MAEQKTDLTVAKTILEQLGGQKFIVMTGSKNFVGDKNSLSMHLTRNKLGAKYLKITLTSMDDYTLEFTKLVNDELVVLKKIEGVFWEDLKDIFEEVTGLYVTLFPRK